MTVHFVNQSRHTVMLKIDAGEYISLLPYEVRSVILNNTTIHVSIKPNYESYISKKPKDYHLIIETNLIFSNVADEETYNITREKVQFSFNTYYDRFFISSSKSLCISESYRIISEEKIKKAFNKSRLKNILIFEPLTEILVELIPLIIICAIIINIWGWKYIIIFLLIIYLLNVLVNWIIYGSKKEKRKFYSFFENEFIKNYYSDINRTPYMGNVEN